MTRTIVMGGGLAGVSAALAISDADPDREVILIESRDVLGGRVASVKDSESGAELDNCQHACFRVYERFLQLLARCGARDSIKLQGRTELPFLQVGGGRIASLRDGRLAPPNHMAGSMVKFPFLSLSDKIAMRKVINELDEMDADGMSALDDITFETWLLERGQTRRSIDRFWGFFVLAALNTDVSEANAALSAFLFKRGLFGESDAFDVGAFTNHLSASLHPHLMRTLEEAGVEVRLSTLISRVELGKPNKVVTRDDEIEAEDIVSALPHHLTARMFSSIEQCDSLSSIEYRSLIGIHALHDSEALPEDFTFSVCVDEPVIQMIFNRNAEVGGENLPQWPGSTATEESRQWVSIPVSAADDYLDWDDDRFLEEYRRVIQSTWPERWTEPSLFKVIRSRKATFAALPGVESKRPPQDVIASRGIHLAGAWTKTGWPSTMEGAVRSGLLAAASVLGIEYDADSTWRMWPASPERGDEEWREW